jgi:enoyl-CoA hydratase/carnithine racemase
VTDAEVIVETEGVVGRLILNRPDRLNALSNDTLLRLIEAAGRLSASTVRTIVVSGNGRAFCSGYDRSGFEDGALTDPDEGSRRQIAELGGRMADAIAAIRQVTVAALHGHVIGGGVVLAAACDLRVAAANTVFAIPEIDLGIPVAWGGIDRLVAEIGPTRTRELVMTCRTFTADEAAAIGLVNRVVPAGASLDAAMDLAGLVAAKPALPIAITKRHIAAVAAGDHTTDDVAGLIAALDDPESSAARRTRQVR